MLRDLSSDEIFFAKNWPTEAFVFDYFSFSLGKLKVKNVIMKL